ncbi:MAG TPA: TetR/AcrR family transcriptional regulator [Thermoleophilaceae bacterium]|nr:TetR/AcrR family transcriptional regulator [Thermoleophilaceae bacterium]
MGPSRVSRIGFHKLTGMRPRNQAERRRQLANAGRHVLLERGAVGMRVKDIAERAGITPSSVLYYYPRIDELMVEVSREAMERYAERRSRQLRALDDPVRQLRLAIHLGVPTGPDDDDSRLLYELDAFIGSSPAFRVLSSSFFDRQVLLYQQLLESGAAQGVFRLGSDAESLARGLVAMEDGLGLQVVVGHPGLDSAEAERILLRHASAVTGSELEQVPLDGVG